MKTKLKNYLLSLVFMLFFTIVTFSVTDVKGADIIASGNCGADGYVYDENGSTFGSNATWTLDIDGQLTITGIGKIYCTSDGALQYTDSNGAWLYPSCPWYDYTNRIKSIMINEGITGNAYCSDSFSNLKSLESVSLPSTYAQLDSQMFSLCENLKYVNISDGVSLIENGCFAFCSSLKTITIPSSVKKINNYAFISSALTSITFLSTVPELEPLAFNGCLNLLLESDDASSYLIKYAKENNIKCKYPTLKNAQISLSQDTFVADKSEKKPSVTIDYNGSILTEGVDYTVSYKNNIGVGTASVIATGLGKYGDTLEKTFTINGVSINNADIALKRTIYTYDGSAKTPTAKITYNGLPLTENEDYIVSYKDNRDDGTAYIIITGQGMFVDAVSKSFVILPYNSGMDSVYEDGTLICDVGVYGITDDENNEVEFCCPSKANITNLTVPATIKDEDGIVYKVTSIGKNAFYKNSKLKTVAIGNNVKSIESYAFYGCKNISHIKFGNGIELIENSAFRKCTKLTSVTLPKSLSELSKNAFYGCTKLKNITFNSNSVVDIETNAIKNISKKAVIKVPKKLVKKYKKVFNNKTGFKRTMKIKNK